MKLLAASAFVLLGGLVSVAPVTATPLFPAFLAVDIDGYNEGGGETRGPTAAGFQSMEAAEGLFLFPSIDFGNSGSAGITKAFATAQGNITVNVIGVAPNASIGARNRGLGALSDLTQDFVFAQQGLEGFGQHYIALTLSGLVPLQSYELTLFAREAFDVSANLFQAWTDRASLGGHDGPGAWLNANVGADAVYQAAPGGVNNPVPTRVRAAVSGLPSDDPFAYGATFLSTADASGVLTVYGWEDPESSLNAGRSRLNGFQIGIVPEPGTLALLGLGLIGIGHRRRVRRPRSRHEKLHVASFDAGARECARPFSEEPLVIRQPCRLLSALTAVATMLVGATPSSALTFLTIDGGDVAYLAGDGNHPTVHNPPVDFAFSFGGVSADNPGAGPGDPPTPTETDFHFTGNDFGGLGFGTASAGDLAFPSPAFFEIVLTVNPGNTLDQLVLNLKDADTLSAVQVHVVEEHSYRLALGGPGTKTLTAALSSPVFTNTPRDGIPNFDPGNGLVELQLQYPFGSTGTGAVLDVTVHAMRIVDVVPEPMSVALLGVGLVALGAQGHRRRERKRSRTGTRAARSAPPAA